jgi:hypothetical protein
MNIRLRAPTVGTPLHRLLLCPDQPLHLSNFCHGDLSFSSSRLEEFRRSSSKSTTIGYIGSRRPAATESTGLCEERSGRQRCSILTLKSPRRCPRYRSTCRHWRHPDHQSIVRSRTGITRRSDSASMGTFWRFPSPIRILVACSRAKRPWRMRL